MSMGFIREFCVIKTIVLLRIKTEIYVKDISLTSYTAVGTKQFENATH